LLILLTIDNSNNLPELTDKQLKKLKILTLLNLASEKKVMRLLRNRIFFNKKLETSLLYVGKRASS
jgi:hypothetical protein